MSPVMSGFSYVASIDYTDDAENLAPGRIDKAERLSIG
jgi:hypothetical protein